MVRAWLLVVVGGLVVAAVGAHWEALALELARAEIALRDGDGSIAGASAAVAHRGFPAGSHLSFRSLSVAARAAHFGNDEEGAAELYRQAERAATGEDERREARWGLISALSELESKDAWDVLAELRSEPANRLPSEVVKTANRTLLLEMRSGSIRSLNKAAKADSLLGHTKDPFARCSFRSVYAGALAHTGDYSTALDVTRQLRDDAQQHRLSFVLPYADCAAAQALCGLRRYRDAEALLLAALVEGNRRCDAFLAPLAAALLIRLYSQSGRLERALEVDVDLSTTIASITGEYLSSRAVALACVDRIEESITLADQAQSATRGIEARVVGAAARLIAAIRGRRGDVRKAAENLLAASEDSNGVDLLVSAYRSSPDLLAVLVRSPDLRARLLPILRRTGDDDA